MVFICKYIKDPYNKSSEHTSDKVDRCGTCMLHDVKAMAKEHQMNMHMMEVKKKKENEKKEMNSTPSLDRQDCLL